MKLHLFCQIPVARDNVVVPVFADDTVSAMCAAKDSGFDLERDQTNIDRFTDQHGRSFMLVTDPEQLVELMPLPKFDLGRVVITPGCLNHLDGKIDPSVLIARHQHGDYGDLDDEDKRENERSIKQGLRILSCYVIGGEKVYLITEADRSVTTLLLASEY